MNIKGKLIAVLPMQIGNSTNGQWKKQDIIIETDMQHPKKICVCVWGDKINESQLQIGNILDVAVELESREYNNKWYTDVKAWKIATASTNVVQNSAVATDSSFGSLEDETSHDLPF